MKKLQWIFWAVLTAMTMDLIVGCSKDEPIPEYEGDHLIVGDRIYIKLYAPLGMRYAPVSEEMLPMCLYKTGFIKMLDELIVFEGKYNRQDANWGHCSSTSSKCPFLLRPYHDYGSAYEEIDYRNLTCIYVGKDYNWTGQVL